MSAPKIAVIVLNYRGQAVLARCLTSLRGALSVADHILIVDNGGETELRQEISRTDPEIEWLVSKENRGFAAGMNLGIRHLQAKQRFDAYWLLNNDAWIDPQALQQLKRALEERGQNALYSPVIYGATEERPWFAGGRIDFLRMRTVHQRALAETRHPYETKFLTGCALCIPQAALDRLGLLDERYFLYYEDAAYSLKALRQGLKLWVVPTARVYHSEESERHPAKVYWLVRSGVEFFLRESRGGWATWVTLYLQLRKLKNWFEYRQAPRALAAEVKRAYTDVSL